MKIQHFAGDALDHDVFAFCGVLWIKCFTRRDVLRPFPDGGGGC
jgi:hypothetical protein